MPRLTRGGAAALLACVGVLGASGCGKRLGDAECRKLLDRYTELLVREEQPGASPEDIARALEEARKTAAEDPRFEWAECPKRVPRASYDCALSAPNVDSIERCLVF